MKCSTNSENQNSAARLKPVPTFTLPLQEGRTGKDWEPSCELMLFHRPSPTPKWTLIFPTTLHFGQVWFPKSFQVPAAEIKGAVLGISGQAQFPCGCRYVTECVTARYTYRDCPPVCEIMLLTDLSILYCPVCWAHLKVDNIQNCDIVIYRHRKPMK
jgi:hypothetical protein